MDLTQLSDADLLALQSGDLTKLSDEGLGSLSGSQSQEPLSRTDKYLKGVKDPFDAGAQILEHLVPEGVKGSVNKFNNYLADKTGMFPHIPEGGVDELIKSENVDYEKRREAQGESGFDGYRTIGNIVNPANVALASKIPTAATALGKIGTGAVAGGALSGLTAPVTDGDFLEKKKEQIGMGMLGGGLFSAAGSGLSRAVSPKASLNKFVQKLRGEGVNPTVGQTLGGRANALEEKLQSVPIFGDMITRARGKAASQFETAAHNTALKPLGQTLPKGMAGNEAIVHTENVLKQGYDDVLNKIGAIKIDKDYFNSISKLRQLVDSKKMPADKKLEFDEIMLVIKDSMDEKGVITSQAYKDLESHLGRTVSDLGRSNNIFDRNIAPAIKQVKKELESLLGRQAGGAAKELKAVNSGWANFKRTQSAASKVGAEGGSFTPNQFNSSVRALDKSKDKAAFARGNALGQELSTAGKTILGNKVPDSGTTGRLLYGGTALAAGAVNPAIPATLVGGAALYSQPVQRMANALLASRPKAAVPMAEFLRKNNNYMVPAGAAMFSGSSNN